MSLQTCVTFIRREEGGDYHPKPGDHNSDPNPTRWGVIQRTYDRYRRLKGLPLRSVYELTEPEWTEIFHDGFYVECGADRLPEPLDLLIADAAFQSGPRQAVRFLQRAVGTTPDGLFGPETQKAVHQHDARVIAISVIGQRIRLLRSCYDRSVKEQARYDGLSPAERAQAFPDGRPDLFPLESTLNRVKRLQKTARV